MSTSAQILFKFEDGQVLVYKHWDGYPKGVIPHLKEFLKWNGSRNNDPSYTIANYFYWAKTQDDATHTSYGLSYNNQLMSIDYFYTLEFFDKSRNMIESDIEFRIRCYNAPENYFTPDEIIENEKPIQEEIINLKEIVA